MKRQAPEVVDSGQVVTVRPALLNVRAAATFAGCSAGFLNALRSGDVKRRHSGEPLSGPEWCLTKWGIRYRLESLQQWIEHSAIPFGVMGSKRRGPHAANAERADEAAS